MCGIIGVIKKRDFPLALLVSSLKRLEYRGYDSCGVAADKGIFTRVVGSIDKLREELPTATIKRGIAHTRWATHGGVSIENAHPHTDCTGRIFCVHNGIIENTDELKESLRGHEFKGESDSELIPHFFEDFLSKRASDRGIDDWSLLDDINQVMKDAMLSFMNHVKGTFAVIVMLKGVDALYALKRDSPLALGILDDGFILASDIYGFSQYTNKAVFFEDDESAVITSDEYAFYSLNGQINKKVALFNVEEEDSGAADFPHYMIKEVKEQPSTVSRLIESFKNVQMGLLKRFAALVRSSKRVVFIASGSSYHASLIGVYLLNSMGIEAHTIIASEFENFLLVDKDTLVVAVSQSGETMDVISVLKKMKEYKEIVSIVNVPYSSISRMSGLNIQLLAGQEVCVAATKTFTNEIIVFLALAKELGFEINLERIPSRIRQTIILNESAVVGLARDIKDREDIFVIGRAIGYPAAREIALKLKEIAYVHAEGMMGGELKHGTIALIEDGVPVISLIPNHNADMISNTREVAARGARMIVISDNQGDFKIPRCSDAEFAIYACIIGHLLSYHIAVLKGLPIDKPRNLAKSVTVK